MKIHIPNMIPVESSQIESIGHDPGSNTLHVRFKRGGHYLYTDVSAEKHARFMAAESKGKFLGSEIKGQHEYGRLTPEQVAAASSTAAESTPDRAPA